MKTSEYILFTIILLLLIWVFIVLALKTIIGAGIYLTCFIWLCSIVYYKKTITMKELWKEQYCKKFGLCTNNRPNCTCQCSKEIKFIEKLLLQAEAIIRKETLEEVKREVKEIENPYSQLDEEWHSGAENMRSEISTLLETLKLK